MQRQTFSLVLAFALVGLCAGGQCLASAEGIGEQVEVHGRAPARGEVMRGGRHVALRTALADIVPRAYSINLPNAGAWADTPVSWQGRRPFVEVLHEIVAVNPRLVAQVDTDLRLVTVTERAPVVDAQRAPASPSLSLPGASQRDSAGGSKPSQVPVTSDAGNDHHSAEALIAMHPPLLTKYFADDKGAGAAQSAIAPPMAARAVPHAALMRAPPTVSVAAAPALPAAPAVSEWRIEPSDRTVKDAMARWAKEAGWQFIWDVPTDYAVDASATVRGTLEDALHAVVQALQRSQVPIQVILYKGNKVLRVVAEGAA